MAPKKDLTGKKFARLTVLHQVDHIKGRVIWECRCDCGKIANVTSNKLTSGWTSSCGCYATEIRKGLGTKHGLKKVPGYNSWCNMMNRCYNPNAAGFKNYGGRGILVCERWHDIRNFFLDMGEQPSRRYSLERIDNDKNYEPSNCKWATKFEQQNNRRDCQYLTLNNETMTIKAWARRYNLSYGTLRARIQRGLSIKEALTMRGKIKEYTVFRERS